MRSLHGKLSSRDEHQSLDLFLGVIDLLNERYRVRCSLSRSILGASNDVFALHCDRNSLLLNRGRSFITHLIYSLHTHYKLTKYSLTSCVSLESPKSWKENPLVLVTSEVLTLVSLEGASLAVVAEVDEDSTIFIADT